MDVADAYSPLSTCPAPAPDRNESTAYPSKAVFPFDSKPQERTADQALTEALGYLRPAPKQANDPDTPRSVTVLEAPYYSNDPADYSPGSGLYDQAKAMVEANREVASAEANRLSPDDRTKYDSVFALLTQDPPAQLALQTLLLQHRLPGDRDLKGEMTLLDRFASLADLKTKLWDSNSELGRVPSAERVGMLAELVIETTSPECISQQNKNTCQVTVVSIDLARRNPSEYVRLVAGLASPEGKVQLADGSEIRRKKGTEFEDGSRRSTPQRLLEPALVQKMDGIVPYDNKHDFPAAGFSPLIQRVFQAVYGKPFAMPPMSLSVGPWRQAKGMDEIKQELANGKAVPVGFWYGDGPLHDGLRPEGHVLLVTGLSNVKGQPSVEYINPWGRLEAMPEDNFRHRLMAVMRSP